MCGLIGGPAYSASHVTGLHVSAQKATHAVLMATWTYDMQRLVIGLRLEACSITVHVHVGQLLTAHCCALIAAALQELRAAIERLQNGVEKIAQASAQVADLQAALKQEQVGNGTGIACSNRHALWRYQVTRGAADLAAQPLSIWMWRVLSRCFWADHASP